MSIRRYRTANMGYCGCKRVSVDVTNTLLPVWIRGGARELTERVQ